MHELALSYIQKVKTLSAQHGHETDFFRLARSMGVRVLPGRHNAYFPGDPAEITIQSGIYCARLGRRIGLHELAHHVARVSGFEDDIYDLHGDWPGAEETLEALCQVGATVLQIPDPMLREASGLHGDTAGAVAWLHEQSGAPMWAVLRRWVHAEEDAARAAWVSSGPIITDAAAQHARLPFWTHSRVPEVAHVMPHASLMTYQGRVLGAVGW